MHMSTWFNNTHSKNDNFCIIRDELLPWSGIHARFLYRLWEVGSTKWISQSYQCHQLASSPGPRPASRPLQYGEAGEGLIHFLTWVTSRIGQIIRTWATCKPQNTSPARTHWSTTIPSRKMAAHKGAFMSLFTRQSGGQRVLPSQDSEDTQQQFSRARPRSIEVFLLPFYPWRHSREKCTRPSPALPSCKRREAGRGPGNEASHQPNLYNETQACHPRIESFKNFSSCVHIPE